MRKKETGELDRAGLKNGESWFSIREGLVGHADRKIPW